MFVCVSTCCKVFWDHIKFYYRRCITHKSVAGIVKAHWGAIVIWLQQAFSILASSEKKIMVTWCYCQLSEYDWQLKHPRIKSGSWFPWDYQFFNSRGLSSQSDFLVSQTQPGQSCVFLTMHLSSSGRRACCTLSTVGFLSDLDKETQNYRWTISHGVVGSCLVTYQPLRPICTEGC